VRALVARGTVDVVPCGEPTPMLEQMLGVTVRRREDLPDDGVPPIVLRHRWPPRFMSPPAARYVHVQPWEFGAAPRAWIDALRERADAVWCYSTYLRDVYVTSGIPPQRVKIVPLGFDPLVYHPGVEPMGLSDQSACVFLFVGGLPPRKNVGMLIEAYTRAFRAGDAVALLFKDTPATGSYLTGWAEKLRELAARTDIPPIVYLDSTFSDADMARLYRAATALVHPYRGEGFGLPVLEAMACGTPVIVTSGGSTDDFVNAACGFAIPATRVPVGRVIDDFELAAEGWWLQPDVDALAAAMRRCYEDRGAARTRGATAAAHARAGWTWDHAASVVEERVAELLQQPARPHAEGVDLLERYADSVLSRGGEDGMLFELFARLRVPQPFYVEIGVPVQSKPLTTLFAERLAWRGVIVAEPAAPLAAALRDLPSEVDLLVLGAAAPVNVWETLGPTRPRVVVSAAADPDLAAYTAVAREQQTGNTVFLRTDLLPAVGLAAVAP
jgi:glycosyltransferase involved in cell wall biosynthesis